MPSSSSTDAARPQEFLELRLQVPRGVFSGLGHGGPHRVEGIGTGMTPPLLTSDTYDEARTVDEERARDLALPLVFRFLVTERSTAWIYDHHIDWDQRVTAAT